jgi:hypothetical protein
MASLCVSNRPSKVQSSGRPAAPWKQMWSSYGAQGPTRDGHPPSAVTRMLSHLWTTSAGLCAVATLPSPIKNSADVLRSVSARWLHRRTSAAQSKLACSGSPATSRDRVMAHLPGLRANFDVRHSTGWTMPVPGLTSRLLLLSYLSGSSARLAEYHSHNRHSLAARAQRQSIPLLLWMPQERRRLTLQAYFLDWAHLDRH